ncbi:MAG: hypothetical protein JWM03_897 [Rhodocyclales bacterium]|nr:hypothetical protein [Rhodocyclales bacterium]MDB5888025.1 hypothetical protein [Rhodocyclales bacterium]
MPMSLRLARAAWPAFLMACLLELIVFAMVDPADVHWMGHELSLGRISVYSLAFFLFWAVSLAGNALMMLLNCSTCPAVAKK